GIVLIGHERRAALCHGEERSIGHTCRKAGSACGGPSAAVELHDGGLAAIACILIGHIGYVIRTDGDGGGEHIACRKTCAAHEDPTGTIELHDGGLVAIGSIDICHERGAAAIDSE